MFYVLSCNAKRMLFSAVDLRNRSLVLTALTSWMIRLPVVCQWWLLCGTVGLASGGISLCFSTAAVTWPPVCLPSPCNAKAASVSTAGNPTVPASADSCPSTVVQQQPPCSIRKCDYPVRLAELFLAQRDRVCRSPAWKAARASRSQFIHSPSEIFMSSRLKFLCLLFSFSGSCCNPFCSFLELAGNGPTHIYFKDWKNTAG